MFIFSESSMRFRVPSPLCGPWSMRAISWSGAAAAGTASAAPALARRINGKYLMPKSQHLEDRVQEIADGAFRELLETLMGKPLEELQELYNHREIEK